MVKSLLEDLLENMHAEPMLAEKWRDQITTIQSPKTPNKKAESRLIESRFRLTADMIRQLVSVIENAEQHIILPSPAKRVQAAVDQALLVVFVAGLMAGRLGQTVVGPIAQAKTMRSTKGGRTALRHLIVLEVLQELKGQKQEWQLDQINKRLEKAGLEKYRTTSAIWKISKAFESTTK